MEADLSAPKSLRSKPKFFSGLFWSVVIGCLLLSTFFLFWPRYKQYQNPKQFAVAGKVLEANARDSAYYFGWTLSMPSDPWYEVQQHKVIQPFCSDKVWVYEDFQKQRPIVKFCNVDHGEFLVLDTFARNVKIPGRFIRIAWKNGKGDYKEGYVDVDEIVTTDGVEVFTFFMPKYGPDGQVTKEAQEALDIWQKK